MVLSRTRLVCSRSELLILEMKMPTPEEQEILQYLSRMLEQTRSSKIVWARVDPTTFVWKHSVMKKTAQVTLQRTQTTEPIPDPPTEQPLPKVVPFYMFQVLDISGGGNIVVNLNTNENPVYAATLEAIFNLAGEGLSRKGLNVLKDLIQ